jgi:Tfp pilus assembly protein PilF
MKYWLSFSLLLFVAVFSDVGAQPYLPQSDDEIVEVLPARGESWLAIRSLRKQVADHPHEWEPALALVRLYIELGRAESDPRYFGYAEAALTPWLAAAQPTAEALILRATLFQNRHEFSSALAFLNRALARQPRLAQAWLTRAAILEVQGQYAAALNSCLPLQKLAEPLIGQVCLNSTLSVSGQLDAAYQQLVKIVTTSEAAALPDKQWALTTLAEMAERMGNAVAAEQHYRQALKLPRRNGYLLATYADYLLDQNRFHDVMKLLANDTRADALLLRLSLAEKALRLPSSETHIKALTARFAASRQRGDTSHQGDEARFLLHLLNQPESALAMAQANWAVQREPRDARILLEAAVASGKTEQTLQPLLAFLAQSKLQDVRLQALLAQLAGSRA